MALRTKVVNFVGLDFLDDTDQRGRISKVAIVEVKRKPIIGGGVEKVVNPLCVEQGCSSFDPVNRVPFLEQNSARYAPSCPVIPVIRAFFIKSFQVNFSRSGTTNPPERINRVLRVVIGISS